MTVYIESNFVLEQALQTSVRRRALFAQRPHITPFVNVGTGLWPVRRSSAKQAFYADVLVNIRPMNSLARSDQAKVRTLRGRCFR